MLLNYIINGYKVFGNEANLSFIGNKKIKNKDYVFNINDKEILKSAIIYGPNNTGKSALINSLIDLKQIIKEGKIIDEFSYGFNFNFFSNSKEISYNIEFIYENNEYNYWLSFIKDKVISKEILYVNENLIFDRNKKNKIKDIDDVINLFKNYTDKLIVSILPGEFAVYTNAIISFFESVEIANNTTFEDIVDEVINLNEKDFKTFKKILKSADISISNIHIENIERKKLKLFSDYKMYDSTMSLPSIISDSVGTHVFMAYILKILKLRKTGGILVIDEIDRSLHTLLTKNIISIFNDEKNNNLQLIATSHDLLLLDCLYLFRKDQVWFTYKDDKNVYLYSLNTFKSNVDKQIRNKTLESYLKGMFGSLPHPNIESIIFDE